MFKKLLATLTVTTLSAGCSIHTGVVAQFSDDTSSMIGESTANLVQGDFSVSNTAGVYCTGTYNQYSTSAKLKATVKCSDGRFGDVIVLRSGDNLMNGSGIGTLNDGTRIRILLGDTIHQANAGNIWEEAKLQ